MFTWGVRGDLVSFEEPSMAYDSQQILHVEVLHSAKSLFVGVLNVINNMSLKPIMTSMGFSETVIIEKLD